MYSVNKLGSNYQRGKPLPIERRNQILEKASYTSYRTLARLLGVSPSTVFNILKLHRETGGVDCRARNYIRTPSKLTFENSVLLEMIVTNRGSTSLLEIQRKLTEHAWRMRRDLNVHVVKANTRKCSKGSKVFT